MRCTVLTLLIILSTLLLIFGGQESRVLAQAEGWTIEVADDGGTNIVGLYTSLALDTNDIPHVSYWDATADAVKYTSRFWGGGLYVVDEPLGWSGDARTLLTLDASGYPHISY